MYEHATPYVNTLDSFNRISAFLHSGLSWSNYLTTLPPLKMPPTHSDYLETSHHRPSTISSLGGYSDQHPADICIQTPQTHRTSDHSDSDPERHRPTQQTRDSSASSSSHPPRPDHGLAQIKGSPIGAAYDRPITGPRPRFLDEHKSTPHLSTSESDAATNRRADSIREWYRAHTTPIASHYSHKKPSTPSPSSTHLPSNTLDTKDPAVPHPDDDHLCTQPPTHTPPPPAAAQRTLTSVTSFGGCHSAPRPSSNHTRTPHSPLSTASLRLARTTNTTYITQTLPPVTNPFAQQQPPPATSSCPFSLIGPARSLVRTYLHHAHTMSTEPHGAKHVRPSSATTT